MNRRFMVYLPSKTKNGDDVSNLEQISDSLAEMLRHKFGGATRYPATGYFGDQKEQVVVIECYCTQEDWTAASEYLHGVMQALGSYLEQESIACSLDGRMVLVEPAEDRIGLRAMLAGSGA